LASTHPADLVLEPRHVLGGYRPRPLRVPVADGPQQLAVLVHALGQVRQPPEHEVPDAQGEVQIALERVSQIRVAGAAVHEAVDVGVQPHQRLGVAAPVRVDDRGEQPVELVALRRRQPLRRPVGRVALELDPHVGDVREVGDVDLGRERAAPRIDGDEVLEREALDRLAQRRPPDREVAPDRLLVDRRARRDRERDDLVAQLHVGAVGEQTARSRPRPGGSTHRYSAGISP
jgi:hypothetical protein